MNSRDIKKVNKIRKYFYFYPFPYYLKAFLIIYERRKKEGVRENEACYIRKFSFFLTSSSLLKSGEGIIMKGNNRSHLQKLRTSVCKPWGAMEILS